MLLCLVIILDYLEKHKILLVILLIKNSIIKCVIVVVEANFGLSSYPPSFYFIFFPLILLFKFFGF